VVNSVKAKLHREHQVSVAEVGNLDRMDAAFMALAMVNRHSPTYGIVRDLLEEGRIGRLLELRGRGKEDGRGGGEDLWVLGCHVLGVGFILGLYLKKIDLMFDAYILN
jgi:hypothetical protein